MLMNEMKLQELPAYSASVVAFVNCLILAHQDIDERIRIRNEFIGTVHDYLKRVVNIEKFKIL